MASKCYVSPKKNKYNLREYPVSENENKFELEKLSDFMRTFKSCPDSIDTLSVAHLKDKKPNESRKYEIERTNRLGYYVAILDSYLQIGQELSENRCVNLADRIQNCISIKDLRLRIAIKDFLEYKIEDGKLKIVSTTKPVRLG